MVTNEEYGKILIVEKLGQSQNNLSYLMFEHLSQLITKEDIKKLQQAYNLLLEVRRNYEVETETDKEK